MTGGEKVGRGGGGVAETEVQGRELEFGVSGK